MFGCGYGGSKRGFELILVESKPFSSRLLVFPRAVVCLGPAYCRCDARSVMASLSRAKLYGFQNALLALDTY